MSIAPGARLGAYEILSLLGAGGMGEVYRARDTRLNRDVAIKILPEAFVNDADRLARFKREAQVLASLNHPHICALYHIDDAPNPQSQVPNPDRVQFLILELVDGPTLADRIAQGPIPFDEAMPIAMQIADALEAAHEHGIIHRDLKPANIKLTADGNAKVLDFGLAKALDPHAGSSVGPNFSSANPAAISLSPTITSPAMTMAGVILGTAAYMSPEQAKGKPIDKHADIWAFGTVLYEMLTGSRAFQGDGVSDTLASVLKGHPDWSALPLDTPVLVRRLLQHCLVKDPRQRLGDIRDARIDIGEALTGTAIGALPPATRARHRERIAWALAAVGGLLTSSTITLLLLDVIHLTEAPVYSQVIRFAIPPPQGITGASAPMVSPDGRRLVFVGIARGRPAALWMRSLDALTLVSLPGTNGASFPFWSADSRFVGFFAGGMLKKIDVNGGPAIDICEAPGGRGGTWNSEGVIIFAPTALSGLQRVSAAGGTPSPLTTVPQGNKVGHRWPQFLPDGRHFLYLSGGTGASQVALASLDTPNGTPIVATDFQPAFAEPDNLLYGRGSTLMRQRLDLSRFELRGDPTPVAENVRAAFEYGMFSVSNTGVLVHASLASEGMRRLVWVNRSGAVSPLNLPAGLYTDPSLSPDGRSIVLTISEGSAAHIWVLDIERGTLGKRTFEGINQYPIWSRDGRYLVFSRIGGALMRVLADGSGMAEPLISNDQRPGFKVATSWSADGQVLAFQSGQDVYVREGDGSVKPMLATGAFEREGRFAPNARWMAYRSDETGGDEIYVQSYPPGGGKVQISNSGGA